MLGITIIQSILQVLIWLQGKLISSTLFSQELEQAAAQETMHVLSRKENACMTYFIVKSFGFCCLT